MNKAIFILSTLLSAQLVFAKASPMTFNSQKPEQTYYKKIQFNDINFNLEVHQSTLSLDILLNDVPVKKEVPFISSVQDGKLMIAAIISDIRSNEDTCEKQNTYILYMQAEANIDGTLKNITITEKNLYTPESCEEPPFSVYEVEFIQE